MKRFTMSAVVAVFLGLGVAAAANADGPTPPIVTPATTCMNCK